MNNEEKSTELMIMELCCLLLAKAEDYQISAEQIRSKKLLSLDFYLTDELAERLAPLLED